MLENSTLKKIDLILNLNSYKSNLNLDYIPKEEAEMFLSAVTEIKNYLLNLENPKTNFDEIKKWSLIYIALHDLFHSLNKENDLTKTEILSTTNIFEVINEHVFPVKFQLLVTAYFVLGISCLKKHHSSEYLISEKVVLGEFNALGGIKKGRWGLIVDHQLMPQIATNITLKVKKDTHHFLVKKYKNFIFDFL